MCAQTTNSRVIFHIDANAAYLSWTAVEMLKRGETLDIRTIPSAIAGDPKSRRGVILAKSEQAKTFGVSTGENIGSARKKCPHIRLYPPDHALYARSSDAMVEVLERYSPIVERYSIDECFLDYTDSVRLFGDPVRAAYRLKDEIREALGFTVNIGVSVIMLLAKMGSELEKPDKVHTLFPEEMGEKMWPLPIGDLFSVGRVSREKLSSAGIRTIGDAARMDVAFLTALLGDAHGKQVYDYAHGVDDTPVTPNQLTERKGIGNSMTIAYDVKTPEQADKILLALSEKIGARLRASGHFANVVSVSIRPSDLLKRTYGHQRKLRSSIRSTDTIYEIARTLFREAWRGEPVRQLGVHLPEIAAERSGQIAFDGVEGAFMTGENEIGNPAFDTIDCTVDSIREKFGSGAIKRGIFADGKEKSVRGRTSPDSENGL